MVTANDFEDINFLNEDSLEDSKNLLKKLFLIDFDTNDWFDKSFLLDVADSRDLYDSTYDKKSLDDWLKRIDKEARLKYDIEKEEETEVEYQINYCLEKLHKATMSILKNYTFELKDYFPNINDDLKCCYLDLGEYLLENMKLNLCAIKNLYLTNKKYISLNDAFKDYIKFNKYFSDSNIRNYILNEIEIDSQTFNIKRRKYRENLKELKKNPNILKMDNKYFYKDGIKNEEINEITKHILLYTLDKWNDFSANEEKYIRITYNDIKRFFGEFLEGDVNTTDIFLFEKIYATYYKIGIYLIGFNKFKDSLNLLTKYMKELAADLIYIVQLPNLIASFDLFDIIMQEYIITFVSNPSDNFKGSIKICKHISCYLIPLYNMVFANILIMYCKANGMKIEKFFQEEFQDEDILEAYRNKCKYLSTKVKEIDKKKIQEQIDLTELLQVINTRTEENKDYQNKIKDILQHIEKCDLKLLDIVKDRESYQKNLKQLILNGIISE